MGTVKISVSIDEQELEDARRRIGERELSSYINQALRLENERRRVLELLEYLDRKFGPINEDDPEVKRVEQEWRDYVAFSTRVQSQHSRKARTKRAKPSKRP